MALNLIWKNKLATAVDLAFLTLKVTAESTVSLDSLCQGCLRNAGGQNGHDCLILDRCELMFGTPERAALTLSFMSEQKLYQKLTAFLDQGNFSSITRNMAFTVLKQIAIDDQNGRGVWLCEEMMAFYDNDPEYVYKGYLNAC